MMTRMFILLLCLLSGVFIYWQFFQCIDSGNSQTIQKVVDRGTRRIRLCQRAHFELQDPITLKTAGQTLTTIGSPVTSADKAMLKLTDPGNSLAINAYNVEGAVVSHLRVDGNRRELAQLVSHGLILVGGNVSHQLVSQVEAFDSRSWTAIHINRGDYYRDETDALRTKCHGVVVRDNVIGPGGEASAGTWSDGISVQCEGSQVIRNTITDVTDGGIVIFGARGSLIEQNTIVANQTPLLVGIAMVDHTYDGNYQGTRVNNNLIEARGASIKAGIAMGPATWDCGNKDKVNYGGSVTNNRLIGDRFGYGLVVSGVKDWTVTGNTVAAQFSNTSSQDCAGKPNSKPSAFTIEQSKALGNFQSEFEGGHVETVHTLEL